jgi:HK97 family phage portal protein
LPTNPILARVASALAVLRGAQPSAVDARATAPLSFPGQPQAQLQIVRSANPAEYKTDGTTVRVQGFTRHPVVHACIRTIVDVIASVPLKAYRDRNDTTTQLPDAHPLAQLLEFPGPRLTPRQFRAKTALDFIAYGNAMWRTDRVGRRITGLRHINPESIQSVWVDTEGDPARYDYGLWSGVVENAPAEDVLHFRDLEMSAPYTPDVFGFPRGATAIQSLLADNEATHYVRQVVTNDGTPTFAIMLHDEATQDDATAVQNRYAERMVGRGNRGKPAVFGGVKDIKPLGFTLSDLEFPDLRRVSREDICAAFGVDPRMIGIASATSDAGLSGQQYREARTRLVQHTIEPLMQAIEDELNFWLASEFGEAYIAFDPDALRDLVEDDEQTSTRVQAEFKAGLRTWEESRTALRLSPVPEPTDTILLTAGSTLTPAAVAVIDPTTIVEPEPNEPDDEPDTESDDESEEESDDEMESEDRSTALATRSDPLDDPRYQYWLRAEEDLALRDVKWYRVAQDRFEKDAAFVKSAFRRQGRDAQALERILREIVAAYSVDGMLYDGWVAAFREVMARGLIAGAQRVAGVGASWTIQSPEVLAAIEDGTRTLAGFVGEDTARMITAAMRAAEVAGLSVNETARLIQATVYGERVTDVRATRIARTENAKATNRGAWGQAQEMGIYQSKEWIAFGDAKTRESHSYAMGLGVVPMDYEYPGESGATLQYPGDPNGGAADVINCRCVLGFYDTPAPSTGF